MKLQQVTKEQAASLLHKKFPEISEMEFLDSVEYYAWPVLYGSTAGPFGGCGGQMMTTFTIEAWELGGYALLFCGNKALKVTDRFEMGMRV